MNRRKSDPVRVSPLVWRLLFAAALLIVALLTEVRAAHGHVPPSEPACACQAYSALPPSGSCPHCTLCSHQVVETPPSWIFRPGRYTHDPATGGRVAQYDRIEPVAPLDDPRLVTSSYSRNRTVLRGVDGSVDTYYRVQSYRSGNGELDAQQERIHDANRGSFPAAAWGGYGGLGYGPVYGGPVWGGGWLGYGGYPGFAPHPGYGWGNGPPGGRRGGPGYATPYGPVLGDAADGYDQRNWRTPDREFFNSPPEMRPTPPGDDRPPGGRPPGDRPGDGRRHR